MTHIALHKGARSGRHPRHLWHCSRGATVAEYAIAAALLVMAWGATESPRFQPVKNEPMSKVEASLQKLAKFHRTAPRPK